MDSKREARRDAATSERAKAEIGQAGKDPHTNSTTWSGPISRFLSEGQQNAVPLRALEGLVGESGRAVRLLIERERRAGVPILSDNRTGYFLPANDEERDRFVRSMLNRSREIERTAHAVENGGD